MLGDEAQLRRRKREIPKIAEKLCRVFAGVYR
jgi:hypothetical protein